MMPFDTIVVKGKRRFEALHDQGLGENVVLVDETISMRYELETIEWRLFFTQCDLAARLPSDTNV